jgi:hypothetical protein
MLSTAHDCPVWMEVTAWDYLPHRPLCTSSEHAGSHNVITGRPDVFVGNDMPRMSSECCGDLCLETGTHYTRVHLPIWRKLGIQ